MIVRSVIFGLVVCLYAAENALGQTSDTTTIRLVWLESFDRISPNPQSGISQTKNLTLTLRGDRRAEESYSLSSGNFSARWKEGAPLGQGWRVAGPNTLTRNDRFPNHTTAMKIIVTGKSCTFSISHNLRKGAPYFLWPMTSQPGRAGRYSRIEAGNTRCSIE
jgi:hypothetical protein